MYFLLKTSNVRDIIADTKNHGLMVMGVIDNRKQKTVKPWLFKKP